MIIELIKNSFASFESEPLLWVCTKLDTIVYGNKGKLFRH